MQDHALLGVLFAMRLQLEQLSADNFYKHGAVLSLSTVQRAICPRTILT
jgi:hypothetical protein